MAVNKVVNIDVKSKGVNKTEKSFENIEKTLKDVKKEAKKALDPNDFKKVTDEVNKTGTAVKTVKVRLRELEDEMAEIGDVGSPQFQKLAREAGGLKDKINNAKAATTSMSADFPKLQLGVQAFSAIGGAASAATGATMLLGSENEEITKGIQKMMAIQAVLNGVNSVANALSDETALGLKVRTVLGKIKMANDLKAAAATKGLTIAQKAFTVATWIGNGAMKALNAVMNMNPIFLIITLLAAGALAFKAWGDDAETAEEASNKFNESLERQGRAFERITATMDKNAEVRRRILKLQGADEEALHQDTLKRLRGEELQRTTSIKLLEFNIAERKALYKKAMDDEDFETAKSTREALQDDRVKYRELMRNRKDYGLNVQEENARFAESEQKAADILAAQERKNRSESLGRYKKFLADKSIAKSQIIDLNISLEEDEQSRLTQLAIVKHDRDLEKLVGDAAQKEELTVLHDEKLRRRLAEIDEQFKVEGLDTKALEMEEFQMEEEVKADIVLQTLIKSYADQQDLREQDAKREKALNQQKIQLAKDGFGAIGALATAFAGSSEKQQRRAFNINKLAGIATATVETVVGAAKAFTSQVIPGDPTSIARAIGAAALATAGGIARVATIAKTKFGSTSSISSGGGASASGISGGSRPANFNIVGDNGTNQLAESLAGTPVKAYVVGSDVTTQQGLDMQIEKTITL